MHQLDGTSDREVSRREWIAGLGLLALAPGSVVARSTEVLPPRPSLLDEKTFDEYIRLRTASDLAPVLWVYSGVFVVKPEGEVARPIARIEGLSRSRATANADGSWLWELDEAGYYCAIGSGRPADSLFNPFTGQLVKPKHYRSPQRLLLTRQGIRPGRTAPPGVEFNGEITRLAEVAGTIALTEDLYVKLPGRAASAEAPARPSRFAASLATFTTRAENFTRPRHEWMDCQLNYTTLNSFVDWLGMEDRGGVQDMRLVGVKCRYDELTAAAPWLLERIKVDHPGLLA